MKYYLDQGIEKGLIYITKLCERIQKLSEFRQDSKYSNTLLYYQII